MHPNETLIHPKHHNFMTAPTNQYHHPTQQSEHYDLKALEIKYTKHRFKVDKFTSPPFMKNNGILAQETFFNNVNQTLLICSGSSPPVFPPYASLPPQFSLVQYFLQGTLSASAEDRKYETCNVINMLLLNFLRSSKTILSKTSPRANNFILTTHIINDGIDLYEKLIKYMNS